MKEEILMKIESIIESTIEGRKLVINNKNRDAMSLLRGINKFLREEEKEYKELKNKINDKNYDIYIQAVTMCLAKQTNVNSYKSLHSNFFDIEDYLNFYKRRIK